ncbi:MAG: DUF87 domain-containing protein [Candidatus Hadarchaeales archaeon]
MKLAVCGKGGSGKSTLVALLSQEALSRKFRVVVVDSDESNPGLFRLLGFERPPSPLLELAGGRKGVWETLEGGKGVLAKESFGVEELPPEYVGRKEGLSLLCVGKITMVKEGCACPLGALAREVLRRLRLAEGELLLADLEAGVEHLGRGVEEGVDVVLVVVDPSFDSIVLAGRTAQMVERMEKRVYAVLNKVRQGRMEERLRAEVERRGLRVAGVIHEDRELFESELEGRELRAGKAWEEAGKVLDFLLGVNEDVYCHR